MIAYSIFITRKKTRVEASLDTSVGIWFSGLDTDRESLQHFPISFNKQLIQIPTLLFSLVEGMTQYCTFRITVLIAMEGLFETHRSRKKAIGIAGLDNSSCLGLVWKVMQENRLNVYKYHCDILIYFNLWVLFAWTELKVMLKTLEVSV